MEDECGFRGVSDRSFGTPRSESKVMIGQKRGCVEVGEKSEFFHKRVQIRDLESVFCTEGIDTNYPKFWKKSEAVDLFHSVEKGMSQVTKETVTMNSSVVQSGRIGKAPSQLVVGPPPKALDLNAQLCVPRNSAGDGTPAFVEDNNKLSSLGNQEIQSDLKSRCFGLDLNAEDVPSYVNHDPFYPYKNHEHSKLMNASDCGSSIGPLEEKDSMRIWKEMKQNGFLSSSHGGVPMPKPRGRKSKKDGLNKKMELAKREQVDKFAKIAAPSGLLNGLNPGIINHVRNSKQVHSIIEALVRSKKLENRHAGSRQAIQTKNGMKEFSDRKDDLENLSGSGMNTVYLCQEDGSLNALSESMQLSRCPMNSELTGGDDDSSIEERGYCGKTTLSSSNVDSKDDILTLKLSSSTTMASGNMSSLSNEDSANLTIVTSLSVQAAHVASQWLELLHQDIGGRLAALRRSKKRVRAVIQTELPFLILREFSSNQENDPCVMKSSATGCSGNTIANLHRARWSALFEQMDRALSEEEKQLGVFSPRFNIEMRKVVSYDLFFSVILGFLKESWLNQVNEMQLHCERGLSQYNATHGLQQLGALENDCRLEKADNSERDLAVRAAAASIYSTSNFLLSMENLPCF